MKSYKFLYITITVSVLIHACVIAFLHFKKPEKKDGDYTVVEYMPKEEPKPTIEPAPTPKPTPQMPEVDNRIIPPLDDKRDTTLEHDRLSSPEKSDVAPKRIVAPKQNTQKEQFKEQAQESERKDNIISSIDINALLNTKDITERIANESIQKKEKDGEDTASYNRFQERYASYFGKFRARVYQIWRYPQDSIARGERGVVAVTFSILKDGSIVNIKMMKSSGYPSLDREVMRVLKSMGKIPLPTTYELNQLNVDEAYFFYDSDESINRWIR